MAIPDFQTLMLPLLKYLHSVQSSTFKECVKHLADEFSLTEDERKQMLPSGRDILFRNRVGWSRTHLFKAGLIDSPRRGILNLSDTGIKVLTDETPVKVDMKYLMQFEKYKQWRFPDSSISDGASNEHTIFESTKTPKEMLEESYTQMRNDLAQELLQKVKECSPEFFERLVVDLLLKMGYGGSRSDAGKAIGKTGDGGIDGIINEDRLGLDSIYIQAKRWDDTTVGQPEIQKFVGAMAGRHGGKGVFITTSTFSQNAVQYASSVQGMKIKLIDGKELAQYMIDFDIGTSEEETYVLKRMDTDYFSEE